MEEACFGMSAEAYEQGKPLSAILRLRKIHISKIHSGQFKIITA